MHRRAFLATTGTALFAGCSSLSGTQTTPRASTTSNTTTATETPTTSANRETHPLGAASVVSLETGPRALSVPYQHLGPDQIHVSMAFTGTATADQPATLAATVKNEGEWRETLTAYEVPPFYETVSTRLRPSGFNRLFTDGTRTHDQESRLYLAPTANHDLVDEGSPVRRGSESYWETAGVPTKLPSSVTLDPGETVHGEYYVVGGEQRTGFPTGQYRFTGEDRGFVLAAWNDEQPGPSGQSRFSRPVPSLSESHNTPWFHEASADTGVYLEPNAETVDPPNRLAFRLVNHTATPITGNPYRWGCYKLVDGAWHHIAPWAIPMPASAVSPGQTYDYTLSVFHETGFDADSEAADLSWSLGRLGGGLYAFEAGFSRENAAPPAALFELDAPQLSLAVPDDATVSADGTTVTFPAWSDGQRPGDATLTVERAPDASPNRTLIAEVVTRQRMRALAAALAVLDGQTTVVVRADENAVERVVGYDANELAFRFRGRTYRATADRSPST